jgi:hypothetical protein
MRDVQIFKEELLEEFKGKEDIEKIERAYGRFAIHFGTKREQNEFRNREIESDFKKLKRNNMNKDLVYNMLAQMYGLHKVTIWKILKRREKEISTMLNNYN